ncbi:hypothetical protein PMIN04_010313 [Paraphaeosphaeria minitans]
MPPKRKRQEDAEFGSLWMHAATNTPPRRKACQQCFEAKVRCNHTRPVCSRCTRLALHCDFSGAAKEPRSSIPTISDLTTGREASNTALYGTRHTADPATVFPYPTPLSTSPQARATPQHPAPNPLTPDHQPIPLVCTVDAERVRDRWLAGWVPAPDQRPKNLSRGTAVFIHSVLRAYPQMLCRGNLPPIMHKLQLVDGTLPLPLANTACIARMWEGLGEGSKGFAEGGRAMVRDTTTAQMSKLGAQTTTPTTGTPWDLVAAVQAYVMYATLLVAPDSTPVIPQHLMLTLQDLAHAVCQSGLVHPSEIPSERSSPGSRPAWSHWVLAEAKRRALIAVYLLDDCVNVFAGVSCIRGDELAQLPAPCSEKLWRAESEETWERLWDVHVAEWAGGGLRLEELWGTEVRGDERVERWVRDVDALGMTVLGVTTAISGNR